MKVYGPSMLPTLNFTGDVLLVDKLSPLLGKVGTGDVVLVQSPENPRKQITKRIVGVEGDTVTFLVDPGRSERSNTVVVGIYIWTITVISLALIILTRLNFIVHSEVANESPFVHVELNFLCTTFSVCSLESARPLRKC